MAQCRSASRDCRVSVIARGPGRSVEKLGESVVREVVDSIVTGAIKPGESLSREAVICEDFAVSRTVVRESIKRIQEKGLISVQQGRGTIVMEPTQWNLLDPIVLAAMVAHDDSVGVLDEIAVIRAGIESEMAAEVAKSSRAADVLELSKRLDDQRAARSDLARFRDADLAFHQAIISASGNRLGRVIARGLVGEALASDRFHGHINDDVLDATLLEHQAILAAIAAGEPDQARTLMRTHVEVAWKRRRLPALQERRG